MDRTRGKLGKCILNSGFYAEQRTVALYKEASKKGSAEASFALGYLYKTGNGATPKDLKRASAYYKRAAEAGHIEAQFNLGRMYATGSGVRRNLPTALTWYTMAAKAGYVKAIYNIGCMYRKGGRGVLQNELKAFQYFQLAAYDGYTDAMFQLAQAYRKGQGTEVDVTKALYWYDMAIQHGHQKATNYKRELLCTRFTLDELLPHLVFREEREQMLLPTNRGKKQRMTYMWPRLRLVFIATKDRRCKRTFMKLPPEIIRVRLAARNQNLPFSI